MLGSINLVEKGVWTFQVGNKNIKGLSELDKVVLNLLFTPCMTNVYKPRVSRKTGLMYCGRRVIANHNQPARPITDGHCGPGDGGNCPSCITIKEQTVGKHQGWSAMVYCGVTDPTDIQIFLDDCCGPSYGTPFQSCW